MTGVAAENVEPPARGENLISWFSPDRKGRTPSITSCTPQQANGQQCTWSCWIAGLERRGTIRPSCSSDARLARLLFFQGISRCVLANLIEEKDGAITLRAEAVKMARPRRLSGAVTGCHARTVRRDISRRNLSHVASCNGALQALSQANLPEHDSEQDIYVRWFARATRPELRGRRTQPAQLYRSWASRSKKRSSADRLPCCRVRRRSSWGSTSAICKR